jgi:hypothetical protein
MIFVHAEQLLRFTLLLVLRLIVVLGQFCLATLVCNSIYCFNDMFLSSCHLLHDEFECFTALVNMVLLLM